MLVQSELYKKTDYDEAARQILAVLIGAGAASQNGKNARCWTFASDELATKTNAAWSDHVYATTNVLSSYDVSNADEYIGIGDGTFSGRGQAIRIDESVTIYKIRLSLKKVGSPTGNITVSIFAATGTLGTSAVPVGSELAIGTMSATDLLTSAALYDISLSSPLSVSPGNYCIVVTYPGNASNYIQIGRDKSSPSDAGNHIYNTGSWAALSSADTIYYILGAYKDITLSPSVISVSSAPTRMDAYFLVQPVDTITLNTDLKVEVSRDGGTTWSGYGTLKLVAAYDATYNLYRATFKDTALPTSGTSLLWRLTTYNNKQIAVRGAVLFWEF